jgi:hypothetical protein
MHSFRKNLIIIGIGLILAVGLGLYFFGKERLYQSINHIKQTELSSRKEPDLVSQSNKLVWTTEEKEAIDKWKDKSLDDLILDAFLGDPGALWMVGMCYLTGGGGFEINTDLANNYMAISASLGFAPALDDICRMYANDQEDTFLALVYLNLAVAHGHPELVQKYYNVRSELISFFKPHGLKLIDEIEKIAIHKKQFIAKFKEKIKDNPESTLLSDNVISEDVLFDNAFWDGIYTGRLSTGNINEWLKFPENYGRKVKKNAEASKRRLQKYATE